MKALHASFFMLAMAVLSPDATIVAGAPKGKKAVKDAKTFGPVKNGRLCEKEGVTSNPNTPTCTGIFDDDTETCTDTYLPCTCSKTSESTMTWACPMAKCMAPDERCTCDNPDVVVPEQACYKEGLKCNRSTPACTGIFDEATQTCTDTYVPCTCSETGGAVNKTWTCPPINFMCIAPDERCTCDNPKLVGPGQACYKEGLVCPNDEGIVVCTGIWDAATKTCSNVTVTPDCSCEGGEWICAFADCAIADPRCT
jgi:hypothetical protein